MRGKNFYYKLSFIVVLAIFVGIFGFGEFFNLHYSFEKPFKLGLDLAGGSRLIYEADMSSIPVRERDSALDGVRDVIERRVDIFGVSEPRIMTSKTGDNYRLVVELPGVKDLKEALEWIGETPLLEFKEQNPLPELTPEQEKEMADFNIKAQERAEDIFERIQQGEDFSALAKEYSEDPGSKEEGGDLGWFPRGVMIEEFERVVFDELKEGEISETLVKTFFGFHIIKKTGEREVEGVKQARASHILIKTKSEIDFIDFEDWEPWRYTGLDGSQLKTANVTFDQTLGQPQVALEFKDDGVKLFEEITKRNIGKPLAIFLDGKAIIGEDEVYAPIVRDIISGGKAVISGNMNIEEAKLLAQRLRHGALAVNIGEPIYQKTIGPTLGEISFQKSWKAIMVGFLTVCIFMTFYYRLPGIIASIALLIYLAILLSLFKLIPVTLTLAGIGGVVLSIGMAVDANVLIFERLKEELREKKPFSIALEEAFNRAWFAIRDGSFTTLIVAFIMFMLGTSFIKGFALCLSLGILVSLFSAIFISKTFLQLFENTRFEKIEWLWK